MIISGHPSVCLSFTHNINSTPTDPGPSMGNSRIKSSKVTLALHTLYRVSR